MNYLRRKYMALMRGVNFRGYLRKASGYPLTLTDCMDSDIVSLSVAGNAVQDGTPSPDAPVEVVGVGDKTANLFDVNAITSTSGGYIENGVIYVTGYPYVTGITPEKFLEMTGLQEGDTFTTDCEYTQISSNTDGLTWGNIRFASKTSGYSRVELLYAGKGKTSTVPEGFNSTNYNEMYIYSGRAPEEGNIYSILRNFAVYEGTYTADTKPEYEPYGYRVPIECDTGDTVNIYTDKPLYGIDDYTDSITLDFEKKKAVRTDRVKEIMLSALSVYKKCENVIRFAKALSSYKGARMMCDKLQCLGEGKQAYSVNFECLFMHDALNTRCYFSLNKTRIGAEDTDTDSQLVEKANAYLADNPITAYYKLGTPTETDISDTIDWDSLSLHLQKGTNILTSTATVEPTGMTAEYYSSKEV